MMCSFPGARQRKLDGRGVQLFVLELRSCIQRHKKLPDFDFPHNHFHEKFIIFIRAFAKGSPSLHEVNMKWKHVLTCLISVS